MINRDPEGADPEIIDCLLLGNSERAGGRARWCPGTWQRSLIRSFGAQGILTPLLYPATDVSTAFHVRRERP